MAAANFDFSGFFGQRVQIAQYSNLCKSEAARGMIFDHSLIAKEHQEIQKIHISNNAYYGHNPVKPLNGASNCVDDTRLMDCEMAPISSHCMSERTLGRKRTNDDVIYTSFKRFRKEESAPPPPPQDVHSAPHSPALYRQTHCNPDVTRCLMAHMI